MQLDRRNRRWKQFLQNVNSEIHLLDIDIHGDWVVYVCLDETNLELLLLSLFGFDIFSLFLSIYRVRKAKVLLTKDK